MPLCRKNILYQFRPFTNSCQFMTTLLTISMPVALKERLSAHAADESRTVSAMARLILETSLPAVTKTKSKTKPIK